VRNLLDGRYYAIKKIRLNKNQDENKKILREVTTLSRLQHQHIVRYYQAWIEDGESIVEEADENEENNEETGSWLEDSPSVSVVFESSKQGSESEESESSSDSEVRIQLVLILNSIRRAVIHYCFLLLSSTGDNIYIFKWNTANLLYNK
jgi:serine/threonine protein kinase